MSYLYLVLQILLFVALLGFAVKNGEVITVRYLFDLEWQAPLVVVLFTFFALGAVLGGLSTIGTVWRLRRELKRARAGQEKAADDQKSATPGRPS